MPAASTQEFIQRWRETTGNERANYQLFLTELCEVLEVPRPDPASEDSRENAYVFERKVTFRHPDGTQSHGFIDLYKRECFVLEAKKPQNTFGTQGWDDAMLRAHSQAQQYARALPAAETRPPFLVVTDVGRSLNLYSEFTRSGATYVPFPDPRSHRISLDHLERDDMRERLRAIWTDPLSLDPSRRSARVTKAIARDLAELAEALEKAGYDPDSVAAFLMRCLFTMFAEDVGLLPKRSFTKLLEESRKRPEVFTHLVPGLWKTMNHGGFSPEIREDLLRFNGGLFAEQRVLPLDKAQIELLLDASKADWRDVEPAIFGTLLERALDPVERHKLGAHYTPRNYVERLVMPAVIEPLREEWATAQAAALTHDRQGKRDAAVKEVTGFLKRLSRVRVLDPACGSGNFLYVTLEHLKRLEGEVFNTLDSLGQSQGRLEYTGLTVDPHQMLGLESNPRAARIADAVLWIGYLQWHFRTRGNIDPPQPVLRDYHNIEARDAVLAWDRVEFVNDEKGRPVTRWDGRTTKPHPVTGEEVPDERAQAPLERYIKPRKAEWPEADFVIGNPPFIGAGAMRRALGDGYVEALRQTYPELAESSDYVMYWWHVAAGLARAGKIERFGLITTNSIRQAFNRRVLERHLGDKKPVSLVFAVPDHPWVDSSDGAAVRIAMTVGEAGERPGVLQAVLSERPGLGEGLDVVLAAHYGKLHANLRIGANIAGALSLRANGKISSRGVQLFGAGFIVDSAEATQLGLGRIPGLERHIRDYRHGRDLTQTPRRVKVIDLFDLEAEQVRQEFPEVYQRLLERVKPERDAKSHSKDGAGYAKLWWWFGKPRQELRQYLRGLFRYIATVETSKHRFFVFLDHSILPDNMVVNIALDDAFYLGVLSSRTHVAWALAVGGRLGVGNDPRYNKTRCFETFPFVAVPEQQKARIRDLGEQLDAHRKSRQDLHPDLTMTGMYNVLEKVRTGEELPPKDKTIHEQGLVSVLGQIHDELDNAVLEAYGWSDLAPALAGKPGGTSPTHQKTPEQAEAEEALLERIVTLNARRAAEEARGVIHWLRPEWQSPQKKPARQEKLLPELAEAEELTTGLPGKRPWPKALPEQVRAIRAALAEQPSPLTAEQVARSFTRAQSKRVAELLETLVTFGKARLTDDQRYMAG